MEFASGHRKLGGGGRCCVQNCRSTKRTNDNLSFHKVPARGRAKIERKNLIGTVELVDKRKEWLKNLNLKDLNKEMLVCSLHFHRDDYNFPDIYAHSRVLKRNAVPKAANTLKEKTQAYAQRTRRTELKQLIKHELDNEVTQEEIINNEEMKVDLDEYEIGCEEIDPLLLELKNEPCEQEADLDHGEHEIDCEEIDPLLLELKNEPSEQEAEASVDDSDFRSVHVNVETAIEIPRKEDNDERKTTNEKSVQVSSGDFQTSFCLFVKSDKDLLVMCNIKSVQILDELVKLMDEIYPRKKRRLMSTRECIILTTARLKLDIPFAAFGVLCNSICDVTIRNIFYDTLLKLATILQAVLTRVPKEEIKRNIPIKCFNKFKDTASVTDCTEINIQKHYKGDLTIKFLTEVTPAGILVHISKSFGGQASDKCIFNYSNILRHLETPSDAVMVDKKIDDECMKKRINLIRPSCARSNQQKPESDAISNREIASAKAYTERMNARIKEFKILSNKIPWNFVPYVDDIFLVCCGLANLGTPILADDMF